MTAPWTKHGRLALLATALLVASAACSVNIDPRREGFPCDTGGTCENGLVCQKGVCVLPGGHGGDGGTPTGPVTKVIGFPGGDVTDGAITVHFPLGALAADTTITVSVAPSTSATGYSALSKVVTVAPEGLTLARPVVVTLPVTSTPDAGYWSAPSGSGFERVGVETGSGTATLRVVQLGSGFAGMHAAGDDTLTVYGVVADISSAADGPEVSPWDLSNDVVQVLEPGGAGSLKVFPGTGGTNGILRIPNVLPASSYRIGFGSPVADDYVVTSSATVDLSVLFAGRLDAAEVSATTTVTLSGSKMSAFAKGDSLEVYVPNLDLPSGPIMPSAGVPAVGATSFTGEVFPWTNTPLPVAGRGDQLLLTHLRTRTTAAGDQLTTIVDMASTSSLTVQGGTDTQASLTFTPVPQTQSQTIAIDRNAFLQALSTMPSFSELTPLGPDSFYLYIDAYQTPAGYGLNASFVDLLSGSLTVGSGPDDLGNVSFGDPFGGSGTRAAEVAIMALAQVTTASASYVGIWMVEVSGPPGTLFASSVRPTVGLPGSVQIGGQAATGPLTGVGATPEIVWKPATGTQPDFYLLRIFSADTSGATPTVARITTTRTKVQVPPDILQAGGTYYAYITAMATSDVDPVHAPWLTYPVSTARATTTTPPFSP